ncbi:hypothetical protein ABPG72_005366 [Tetrahymena utriculariae]
MYFYDFSLNKIVERQHQIQNSNRLQQRYDLILTDLKRQDIYQNCFLGQRVKFLLQNNFIKKNFCSSFVVVGVKMMILNYYISTLCNYNEKIEGKRLAFVCQHSSINQSTYK